MGLSTARLLQLHGAKVTLYTRDPPPGTTSNIADAQWWAASVFSWNQLTDAFGDQFVEAANLSYRYFQNLVGPQWGVRWIPNYYLSDGLPTNGWLSGPGGVLHHLQIGFRDFAPGAHIMIVDGPIWNLIPLTANASSTAIAPFSRRWRKTSKRGGTRRRRGALSST